MAERTSRRVRLDTPLEARRGVPRPHYDPDAFGRISERIARFLGTARFLVYMTAFIVVWIGLNVSPIAFDPYTFTFLTLLLSLQASYAAPLILLAQNRQADRDRVALEEDRATSQRLQADVEYLSREVAALRLALGEVATRDFLRDQLREAADEVVARVSGSEEDDTERQARVEREERERRAERKKRRAGQRADQERGDERPDIGEPFVGEPDET
ncbi:MAG TPA: DUF1003 domain-containing protein [Mycobacteriales bacterium]|nr:DUF1003 domain-containing protein [Mycobacteriales bacterium]